MKTTEIIKAGTNYTAASIGNFAELSNFLYTHPMGIEIPGKVFVGESLQCTGTEVSFQLMPAGEGGTFLHTHKENEELYVVIKGNGEFQVDEQQFAISEGSIIRVSPNGKRSWRNNGSEPLIMMVIQSKYGSIKDLGIVDGARINEEIQW